MLCLFGWMNNTSLGTLDLLHVYFMHDVELMVLRDDVLCSILNFLIVVSSLAAVAASAGRTHPTEIPVQILNRYRCLPALFFYASLRIDTVLTAPGC